MRRATVVEIPLSRDMTALVDAADEWLVRGYTWHAMQARHAWYAVRSVGHKSMLMHRVILAAPQGTQVDHRNGNGLDNRRENLRIADYVQNAGNRHVSSHGRSGYIGVRWSRTHDAWVARIRHQNRYIYLGLFDDPADAACAYAYKARELRGEFVSPILLDPSSRNWREAARSVHDGQHGCAVDGCIREHAARGYCDPHLKRFRKYGDPLAGRRSPSMRRSK